MTRDRTTGENTSAPGGEESGRRLTLEEKKTLLAEALRRREERFPLSFAQERLWFIEEMVPGTSLYNVPVVLRLRGALDQAAFARAAEAVTARHEALRTVFVADEGRPLQVISREATRGIEVVDLTGVPPSRREGAALAAVDEETQRRFDLTRGPLFRAVLFRLAAEESILALTMHHIVSDGWSINILLRELAEAYGGYVSGEGYAPAPLPLQYADFAVWQRRHLEGEAASAEVAWWREALADLPRVLNLPSDRPRPLLPSFRGDVAERSVPAETARAARELGRREGLTPFMLYLSVFALLLGRYTGRDRVVVGSPLAGRTRPETEELIGFFVNTVMMRGDLSGDPPFVEFARRVKRVALEAYDHQEVPFERLVAELAPERDPSHHPLFQVAFTLEDARRPVPDWAGLEVTLLPVSPATAKFDLTLAVEERPAETRVAVEFSLDLFHRDSAERLLGHYLSLLSAAAANPGRRLSRLPLLSAEERAVVVGEWGRSPAPYPSDRCVHELFEERVKAAPEAVAVISVGGWEAGEEAPPPVLTYGELDRRAGVLARRLRALGVGPDVLVGLCLERSVELIVGLTAILKAGGAYLPLDPDYPPERLAFMLEDSRAPVIVTQRSLVSRVCHLEGRPAVIVCLDDESGGIAGPDGEAAGPDAAPAAAPGPDNLAYVIYTSGSTGRPKGVAVPHRAVVRLVRGANYARLEADEVFIQFAPVSFDASTLEVWGALLNGARLVVLPPGTPSLAELGEALRRYGVTTIFLTTALFNLMVEQETEALGGLRQIMFGGELASPAHTRRALEKLPDCRITHVYGPTENTTFTSYRPLSLSAAAGRSVPIGRPIANTTIHVVDAMMEPVPVGVPGELLTGGDGLARGYLGRPDLTAERFVPDPFSPVPGARLYRTGDIVRYLLDGDIDFLGRRDHQVKLRGFRIELGEIETCLLSHPAVREAAAAVREDRPGERRLVAYVAPREAASAVPDSAEQAALLGELRAAVGKSLPEWMTPSLFVVLEQLPLNPNGKVDRAALPAPVAEAAAGGAKAPPRDGLELRLVEAYEELLGVSPVGLEDNFFELGGHSLLAARLVARIQSLTGRKLPLAALFRTPTVEGLASILRSRDRDLAYSPLVGLRTSGGRKPLYCAHAVGGLPHYYAALARSLGPDQPVWGLQARGLYDAGRPRRDLPSMAEAYLAAVKTVQPEGPYGLIGYCLGGSVVFEMAGQLEAAGEKVGLLALIDATAPPPPNAGTGDEPGWFMYAWELVNRGAEPAELVSRLEEMEAEGRLPFLFERGRAAGALPPGVDDLDVFARWLELYRATAAAYIHYHPGLYTGRAVLFRATEQPVPVEPDLGWGRLVTGGLEVVEIEGDHYNIMTEPRVSLVAKKLRSLIE